MAQDFTDFVRDSIIVKDVDPAAMTRDGCSEVFQKRSEGKPSERCGLFSGFQLDPGSLERPSRLNDCLQWGAEILMQV